MVCDVVTEVDLLSDGNCSSRSLVGKYLYCYRISHTLICHRIMSINICVKFPTIRDIEISSCTHMAEKICRFDVLSVLSWDIYHNTLEVHQIFVK